MSPGPIEANSIPQINPNKIIHSTKSTVHQRKAGTTNFTRKLKRWAGKEAEANAANKIATTYVVNGTKTQEKC